MTKTFDAFSPVSEEQCSLVGHWVHDHTHPNRTFGSCHCVPVVVTKQMKCFTNSTGTPPVEGFRSSYNNGCVRLLDFLFSNFKVSTFVRLKSVKYDPAGEF